MSIKYRPDIDGLRAIAVLAVVLFHAGAAVCSGGFVGVDVFLIISGFLITSIIYPEIEEGRFSLVGFYDRRVRRIFPALFVVLAGTTAVSLLVLTPGELIAYGKSLSSTAAFVSNIYFWRNSGYFAQAAGQQPLLHTWTLSLEEQFYILFPLFLLLVLRWARRRRASSAVMALVAILSLALAEYGVRASYAATFYLLPSRAWELLLGALIATLPIPPPRRIAAQIVAACGLALILMPIVSYSPATPFPGFYAVPPCVGAALLIYSGRGDSHTFVARLLSFPPLVYIGRISYSLYLWHWPLLVLSRLYLARTLTTSEAGLTIILSLLLSALSWRYVESPMRRSTSFGGSPSWRLSLGAAGMALVLITGAVLIFTAGLPSRVSDEVLTADKAAGDKNPLEETCVSNRDGLPPVKPCLVGPSANEGAYEVIVWGDSHADHYFPAIVEAVKERHLTVRQITRSSCPPLLDALVNSPAEPHFAAGCAAFNSEVWKVIQKDSRLKFVVLAAYWTTSSEGPALLIQGRPPSIGGSREALTASLTRTVRALSDRGISVLLLGQAPEYPTPPGPCLARAAMFHRDASPCILTDAAASAERTHFSDELLASLARSIPRVSAFFPASVMCKAGSCSALQDGVIFYRDRNHLTASGARWLGRFIKFPAESKGSSISPLDPL